jgi:hypothetical protein
MIAARTMDDYSKNPLLSILMKCDEAVVLYWLK